MTKTRHYLVGRDTLACGVVRSVFFTRDFAAVTCPRCRREYICSCTTCDGKPGCCERCEDCHRSEYCPVIAEGRS